MNYWVTESYKTFNRLIENNTYKYEKTLIKLFNKVSNTVENLKDYKISDLKTDIILNYESLCLNIYDSNNVSYYIECFPYASDDVFESCLLIEDKNTNEILFAQTNTLNNNLYELKLKFSKQNYGTSYN
ncbi:MAG: hypothetical protein ACOCVF_01675 [bacterium]